jgi:endonuclease/exonuclease/phosphatase family metal-dependent hydrolase
VTATDPDDWGPDGDDPLRVATYNVRYANLDEGELVWERRRDGVGATLRGADPDVVALQECWMTQVEDLAGRLPGYGWVAHPDDNGEHTPIAYREDRLEVVDSGAFGVAPGGERGLPAWDANVPRTVTHATLRERASSREFALFSVHLDHQGERARTEGARLVLDRLPAGPAVVAGDYNCEPGSTPYGILAGDLDDAFEAAATRVGPAETYVGFGGVGTGEETPPAPKRIDYAFVRGFEVAAYRTLAHDGDGHPPSDHRPVVVDLVPEG